MTKSQFIEYLTEKYPQITKKDMELIFDTLVESIVEALKNGKRVDVRDFGNFVIKEKKPRNARNPKTGEQVMVPKRKKIYFKIGKGFFNLINSKES